MPAGSRFEQAVASAALGCSVTPSASKQKSVWCQVKPAASQNSAVVTSTQTLNESLQ